MLERQWSLGAKHHTSNISTRGWCLFRFEGHMSKLNEYKVFCFFFGPFSDDDNNAVAAADDDEDGGTFQCVLKWIFTRLKRRQ